MKRADLAAGPVAAAGPGSEMAQILLLCSRQVGKSTVAAALAVRAAILQPALWSCVLSPSLRQSGELFRKVLAFFNALGRPLAVAAESALRIEFTNGSRVVSLPGDEGTIRGFSGVTVLIIDEAARVMDDLYRAVRPMLAVSRGRLVALSTPFGQRGWFYEAWQSCEEWERVRVTADECPRITAEFLAAERRSLGERWFRQEYLCSFEDTIDAVFSAEDIRAALWTMSNRCSRSDRWARSATSSGWTSHTRLADGRRGPGAAGPAVLRPADRVTYELSHLHRFPPGTAYSEVISAVRDLFRTPPLPWAWLLADITGVGKAVLDLLLDGLNGSVNASFSPVILTAADTVTPGPRGGYAIPKTDLVGVLQVLLQTRHLQIAKALPDAPTLVRELATYRMRVPLNRDSQAAWREGAPR